MVAFTLDASHRDRDEFHGLPVVDFEHVQDTHPPDRHELLVSISYQQGNRLRERKFHDARAKGYRLTTWVSGRASVPPGVEIGENCMVFEDNTIQPFTRIGDDVILWSGNHLGHVVLIDDNHGQKGQQ